MEDPREEGDDTKAFHDYVTPTVMDTISGIRKPLIPANNFEIKPVIIQMMIGQIHQEGGELVFKTQGIIFKKLPLFERATARNSERAINQIK